MTMSNVIYQLSKDDLLQLLNDQKAIIVSEFSKSKIAEKPLTREEAAAFLRIDSTTLDRRFRNGTLPKSLRHFNGGTLYFFASELEAHIKKSTKSL